MHIWNPIRYFDIIKFERFIYNNIQTSCCLFSIYKKERIPRNKKRVLFQWFKNSFKKWNIYNFFSNNHINPLRIDFSFSTDALRRSSLVLWQTNLFLVTKLYRRGNFQVSRQSESLSILVGSLPDVCTCLLLCPKSPRSGGLWDATVCSNENYWIDLKKKVSWDFLCGSWWKRGGKFILILTYRAVFSRFSEQILIIRENKSNESSSEFNFKISEY